MIYNVETPLLILIWATATGFFAVLLWVLHAMCLWVPSLVYKDCNSLLTESAKVEAISSLAVCRVCVRVCVRTAWVEGQGKERQTPSHLSIGTWQKKEGGGLRDRGRDVLVITLEKWRAGVGGENRRRTRQESVQTMNNWTSAELALLLWRTV